MVRTKYTSEAFARRFGTDLASLFDGAIAILDVMSLADELHDAAEHNDAIKSGERQDLAAAGDNVSEAFTQYSQVICNLLRQRADREPADDNPPAETASPDPVARAAATAAVEEEDDESNPWRPGIVTLAGRMPDLWTMFGKLERDVCKGDLWTCRWWLLVALHHFIETMSGAERTEAMRTLTDWQSAKRPDPVTTKPDEPYHLPDPAFELVQGMLVPILPIDETPDGTRYFTVEQAVRFGAGTEPELRKRWMTSLGRIVGRTSSST